MPHFLSRMVVHPVTPGVPPDGTIRSKDDRFVVSIVLGRECKGFGHFIR